jgi:hypothetical protein
LVNIKKNATLKRKWIEIATFLPVAAGKCSQRLLDSCRAMPKECRKATEKCLKVIG